MEYHPGTDANTHQSQQDAKPWRQHPYTLTTPPTITPTVLTPQQITSFRQDGYLIVRSADFWTPEEYDRMVSGTNLMDDWPDKPGAWMKYYEKSKPATEEKRDDNTAAAGVNQSNYVAGANDAKQLQRIENFCQYNQQLDSILRGQKLLTACSELFGETSVLYKEKVNYKLPGGEGFTPHQDVAAGWWMYQQDLHISVLISIDEANTDNGCLEVVTGKHTLGMLSEDYKEVEQKYVKEFDWVTVPTKSGDIIFFDSYVPHRSASNRTQKPRRVLYSTYAKASQGDYRDKYYADKRISFPPDCERQPDKKYEYKI